MLSYNLCFNSVNVCYLGAHLSYQIYVELRTSIFKQEAHWTSLLAHQTLNLLLFLDCDWSHAVLNPWSMQCARNCWCHFTFVNFDGVVGNDSFVEDLLPVYLVTLDAKFLWRQFKKLWVFQVFLSFVLSLYYLILW